MIRSSRLLICAAAALTGAVVLAAAAPAAHANGRFPQAIDVRFKPGDDQVYGLQATFGFLLTRDGGQSWRWLCEDAVGFGGVYDPDYAFTSTGLLLATTTSKFGLRLTRDYCSWDQAPAALNNTFVSQVEVSPDGTIFAAAADPADSQLYVSTDDGVSFTARSNPGQPGDWWETLDVAPSNPSVVYLAGFRLTGQDKTFLLLRSDDAGASFTARPVTDFTFGGSGSDLQIAAVSPTDPDLLYARVFHASGVSIGDDIYRSTDGGASWTRVFQSGDDVTSVVFRSSGQIVLTTRLSGIHVSADGTTFGAAIASPPAHCLRERGATLYLCSNGFIPDNLGLGTSTTTTGWVSQVVYASLDGALDCADGTVQHDVCEVQRWCGLVCQLAIDGYPECDPMCPGPAIDAMPSSDGADNVTPPGDDCCNVGGGPAGAALISVLVAVPLVWRRRRARRRAA